MISYNNLKFLVLCGGLLFASLSVAAVADKDNAQTQLQEQLKQLQQPQQTNTPNNDEPPGRSSLTQAENLQPPQAQAPKGAPQPQMPPQQQAPAVQPSTQAQTPTAAPQQQLPVTDDNLRDQAFAGMANNVMPLTPEQIKSLRALFDQVQHAAAMPSGIPPRPTTTSLEVNLAPSSVPPVIRLSAGFVSSLVFLDSTGAPWPVEGFDIGDPNSFNVQWDKKGNTLLVQSITQYKTGNLAVMLKGLKTPVMVTLLPGQNAVDYRVDLRVSGLGPNANPTHMGLPGKENPLLLDVLNGIPPKGSKVIRIEGGDGQAWLLHNKLYLRTRLTVLSPGWIGTMSSADGMHAYEMQKAPVILASEHGKSVQLNLQGL